MKRNTTAPSVAYTVRIDPERCKGCGLCVAWCPQKKLQLSKKTGKRGRRYVQNRQDARCTGCGICFLMCPDWCITIYETPQK